MDLDVEEVERLTADGADTERAQRLESALELWRGRAMAGLSSAALAPEVRRLEELRLDLVEEWAQLTLVRGGHRTVLELLAGEVGEHPLRERLRLRLMEALWAAGRRADALEAYRDGQKVLASELGLDPGQELQALHQQILREERPPRPLQGEDGWSAPHRLPIAPPRFVGRDTQLEDLDVLRRADDIDDHRPGAVIALHGTGGVGKTTLALHWAHAVADDFPDGQLFVNLRGHGPSDSLSVGDALDVLLRALGVEPSHIPDDEDDRGQLLRDRLAGRRLLIVLDNARDSDQVRPLLPGGRHLVLVTSRSQLRSLVAHNGARRIRVEPMGVDEAADLLADRLDGHRAFEEDRHRGALTDLASVCGHLPIALAVAAERAGRYDLPLAALSAELRGDVAGTAPLDALATGADDRDTDVRAVLSWSYDALDDAAARQFRLLGLHPHPTYDAHAASWLAGLDLAAAKQVLDRLVEANLLVEIIPGEYEMHDLVRAFAMEVAHSEGRSEERTEAVARMRAGYAHSATNARTAFIRPHAWLDGGHLPAGVEPRAFSDGNDAASWVRERRHRLMDVVVAAAQDGDHDVVKNVFAQVDGVIQLTSNIAELLAWTTVALESALAAGDPAGEVLARSMLGMISLIEGRPEKAITDTSWCVATARSFDISAPLEVVLLRHGLVLGHLGRHDDAVAANVEGAELADRAGRSPAVFHNNCAQGLMYLERYEEA
ncbi:MAG: NB-ARC domain-containing protein, partial [Actinomycetia bacterium]|nr:NB-ARC domain-containing protein [Actinomycetes bacterium]